MPDLATIVDSSCLIGLEAVGSLAVLESAYGTVLVPAAVAAEWGSAALPWMTVRAAQDRALVQSLRMDLGSGEAEAIALAIEVGAARTVLDDKKARRVARELGVTVTGTVGVLLRAKQRGIIPALRPLLDDLQGMGFRVSNSLREQALRQAGE
jgi:uncharacterized protein